jgi:hypothetical protein
LDIEPLERESQELGVIEAKQEADILRLEENMNREIEDRTDYGETILFS